MRYERETSISLNPSGVRPPEEAVRYVSYARKLLGYVEQECEPNDIPSLFRTHRLNDGTVIRVGRVYEQAYITIETIGGKPPEESFEVVFRFKIEQEYVGEIRGDESILYQIQFAIRDKDGNGITVASFGPGTATTGPIEWNADVECFQLTEEGLVLLPEDPVYFFAENQDVYGVFETQYPDIIKQSEWYREDDGVMARTAYANEDGDEAENYAYTISLPYLTKTKTEERVPGVYQSDTKVIAAWNVVASRPWTMQYGGAFRNITSPLGIGGGPCLTGFVPPTVSLGVHFTPIWFGLAGDPVLVLEGWATMKCFSSLNGLLATATDTAVTVPTTNTPMDPTGPVGVTDTLYDVWDLNEAMSIGNIACSEWLGIPVACLDGFPDGDPPVDSCKLSFAFVLADAYYNNHLSLIPLFDTT